MPESPDHQPTAAWRQTLVVCCGAVVVIGVVVGWHTARQARAIHFYYDMDNERHLAEWSFPFTGLQFAAGATALLFVAIAWIVLRSRVSAASRGPVWVALAITMATSGFAIAAAQYARSTWAKTYDPSDWMTTAAGVLAGQALVAAAAAVLVTWDQGRRSPISDRR